MIDRNAYCATCKFKITRIFPIFIKYLEYQIKKDDKSETNLRSIILKEYYNFLNISSKKNSNTLFLYQKYKNKIILKKRTKAYLCFFLQNGITKT